MQKTKCDPHLIQEFKLRSGTQVKIHWLPHCKQLEKTYTEALALRSTSPLHCDEYYVLKFTVLQHKVYALSHLMYIRNTISLLKRNLTSDAFVGVMAMKFKNTWYWWDDSFYTVLETAVSENLSPYLVPLVGETPEQS
jgi:hypothetical protein